MLRWLTAGESHGPALVAILEGLPAQVAVTSADIADHLARRRLGAGRGARMKFEADEVQILGGVRHGRTQGGPIAIQVGNSEWPKWTTVMAADPVSDEDLARIEHVLRRREAGWAARRALAEQLARAKEAAWRVACACGLATAASPSAAGAA